MMNFNLNYILFIDDERTIEMVDRSKWPSGMHILIARSSDEAMEIVYKCGDPAFCSFDHDLGGDDTTMEFLKWYFNVHCDDASTAPEYVVHSANPIGAKNIVSYIDSWVRSNKL